VAALLVASKGSRAPSLALGKGCRRRRKKIEQMREEMEMWGVNWLISSEVDAALSGIGREHFNHPNK
jgi:hypothetical protein